MSSRRAATRARAAVSSVLVRIPGRRVPGPSPVPGSIGPKPSSAMPERWAASARAAACLAAAARESAARRESLADLLAGQAGDAAAAGVDAGALAGDLGGAGGDLAALVLDAALGLVLLGVLQAVEAALEPLALGPAGLAVGVGGALRVGGAAAGGGGRASRSAWSAAASDLACTRSRANLTWERR